MGGFLVGKKDKVINNQKKDIVNPPKISQKI